MLLLDFSATCYSAYHAIAKDSPVDLDILRHVILNIIHSNLQKFRHEYGSNLVICDDGKNSWRFDVFPHYKAGRRAKRKESKINWDEIFGWMNTIKEEIRTIFPYRFMQHDKAEADDIIAVLTKEHSEFEAFGIPQEKILILSGDADYVQLHKYPNVTQYNPVRHEYVKPKVNPYVDLEEKILHGEAKEKDGIPNILSDDNIFLTGKRQTVLTEKRLIEIRDTLKKCHQAELNREMNPGPSQPPIPYPPNYIRNKTLVDFDCIPTNIIQDILNTYKTLPTQEELNQRRHGLLAYFMDKRLRNLLENIGDF